MSDVSTTRQPPLLDDRYRLDGLAGTGGMGQVHRAWDTRLGRRVAIKMLGSELVADPDVAARLRAEGRHLASIAHPNLVTLYDVSADGTTPYLVMELVEGESLAERLRRDGPLPAREVAAIVTGIAAGLSALHGAGIIHRDVSPANVLLGRDGRPRLADLGLAHELGRSDIGASDGMIHGTLRYLAPELLDQAPATPASDVYALAAVTYAALLGRPPAVATDVVRLRAAHREPPIRPSLLRPGLDPALDEVLLRALGPAPGRPTAYAFAVAIANALRVCADPAPRGIDPMTQTTVVGRPAAEPVGVAYRSPRRRTAARPARRAVAAIGAGALVLALTGAAFATIDHVLERPANPGLVAGLTAASPAPAPAASVVADPGSGTDTVTPGGRAVATTPAAVADPGVRDPEVARDPGIVVEPPVVAGVARGVTAIAAGSEAGARIGLALLPDLGDLATGAWAERFAGSLAGTVAGLLATGTDLATAAPDPAEPPVVTAEQLTPPRQDVLVAVAHDPRPAQTTTITQGADVTGGVTDAARTATVRTATSAAGPRAGASGGTASSRPVRSSAKDGGDDRRGRSGGDADRDEREDREDPVKTAVREDREDREDKKDDREDRAEKAEKEDRADREDKKDDREDRSGKG